MARFQISSEGSRSTLVFDDGRMNLLSVEALEELARGIAATPAEAKLIVFRSGRPRLFAAGADMATMRRFGAAEAERFSRLGQETFAAVANASAATAVLIDGDCFGGALDLCLSFDLRIATRTSRFAHPGGRIGIVTGFAGTVRVPRLASRQGARSLLLANSILGAEEAAKIGLIDVVLDSFDGSENRWLDALETMDRATIETLRLIEASAGMDEPSLSLLARRTSQLHSVARN